jgi:hypothetical protein
MKRSPSFMKFVKKSFNLNPLLDKRINDFIKDNPGVSFTQVMNQALHEWLKAPKGSFKLPAPMTEAEVDQFMVDNKELMDSLAK